MKLPALCVGSCPPTPTLPRKGSEGGVLQDRAKTRDTGSTSPLAKGGLRGVLPGQRGRRSADPPTPPSQGGEPEKPLPLSLSRREREKNRSPLPPGEGEGGIALGFSCVRRSQRFLTPINAAP